MAHRGYAAVACVALLAAGAAHAQTISPDMGGPGNPAHGEALFKQRCSVCHQPERGGKNSVGPALFGVYGRRAGQAPGYTYSENLKAAGFVWTPERLNQWIQKPSSLVPGVKMVIAPVNSAQDRADIIAFLKSEH